MASTSQSTARVWSSRTIRCVLRTLARAAVRVRAMRVLRAVNACAQCSRREHSRSRGTARMRAHFNVGDSSVAPSHPYMLLLRQSPRSALVGSRHTQLSRHTRAGAALRGRRQGPFAQHGNRHGRDHDGPSRLVRRFVSASPLLVDKRAHTDIGKRLCRSYNM